MAGEPSSNSWFRCRRIVEFRDTDAAGIAHFSAFFFWMESAEHEFLRELGIRVVDNAPEDEESLRRELASGEGVGRELEVSWPRVSVSADYKAAVRFGDTLDVFIAVAERGSSSITYRFRFENSGNLVAIGTVVVVRCLMRHGMKPLPVKIPAGISERMLAHQLPSE
ncbi:MAG TPA: thioesterase [Planctomycetaceae bacterium]|jgi:4-hydroxybenzoyl-CoA thioesterase/acyl-CoA thioester hydrolase|nr:thioesterase [Planctomycetaceae bacterium]HBK74149.1 thioesterase [Planctomycetaceae bacterium]HBP81859.1 thioesterase [Planctomycetaceae bacterium]|tara:strand:- start:879 stop:1379 length:501 start_codon:yes stop_codon:yes gene_type:complete